MIQGFTFRKVLLREIKNISNKLTHSSLGISASITLYRIAITSIRKRMPTDFEFMKYISEGTKVIEFEFTLSSRMFITVNDCYGEGKIFDMQ